MILQSDCNGCSWPGGCHFPLAEIPKSRAAQPSTSLAGQTAERKASERKELWKEEETERRAKRVNAAKIEAKAGKTLLKWLYYNMSYNFLLYAW